MTACGYHGWQDRYIGSTNRNLGVPYSVRELTHSFTYNDLDLLEQLFEKCPDQIAAVIIEPMNSTAQNKGFLEEVKV